MNIPTIAPWDKTIDFSTNSLPFASNRSVNNAAKNTAGNAAKIPPIFDPNFLETMVEATTAPPPNKNRIMIPLTDNIPKMDPSFL